mgnify:FL=1|jgi:hypothetical protein
MAKMASGGMKADSTSKKRPGVHSKNNTSKNKKSKNYKKLYKGQGR